MGKDMLGLSFIIMEKVEGQNMDKALNEMTEVEQAELWKHLSQLLADIHHAGLGYGVW